ncbi:PREDICTED: uncharacterized protein LOC108557877 [Nicrophorus vespilloides]|uniref:Uncharacterized protein LOC108557877 n=1 Tax=Nicrophorus vespilloides TaxID=110193 RepID=A0ABM1M669_NICVS|nr:PREDICTED: uncharacterized protein LOC108557877 [Nicrophorus vespilloides]
MIFKLAISSLLLLSAFHGAFSNAVQKEDRDVIRNITKAIIDTNKKINNATMFDCTVNFNAAIQPAINSFMNQAKNMDETCRKELKESKCLSSMNKLPSFIQQDFSKIFDKIRKDIQKCYNKYNPISDE